MSYGDGHWWHYVGSDRTAGALWRMERLHGEAPHGCGLYWVHWPVCIGVLQVVGSLE